MGFNPAMATLVVGAQQQRRTSTRQQAWAVLFPVGRG